MSAGPDRSRGALRGAAAAAVLLAGVVLADLLGEHALLSLPLTAPLLAALVCPPRWVAGFAIAALAAAAALGASNDLFLTERHVVALVVVAFGGVVATLAAWRRAALVASRAVERRAFARIELLDRSSRLIAAPMDFEARLRELSRLVIPDLADLAMIDLVEGGRLCRVIASSTDPEAAATVERIRAEHPIDVESEHPVALALRTGESQLRGAMSDADLERYAASPEHLAMMRRLAYSSAVVVPLVARGTTLGVLSVLRLGTPQPFADADRSLFDDLASRAALAVDNARLFQERAAAQAQLQGIIDHLAEAVTVIDGGGELVYVNHAAAQLFGYGSAQEVLAVPVAQMFADFELLDEDGAPLDPARLPGRRVLRGERDPDPVTLLRRRRDTGEERWLTVKATGVADAGGATVLAVNVIEDVTEERRARAAATFLSEASKLLTSSLEFEETLRAVADAAVPQIADWCAVDLVDERGEVVQVALAHVEADKEPIAAELRERYPPDPDAPTGPPAVRRTGLSELYEEIDPALLEASAVDERHLELLRALDMTSALVVPLLSASEAIGTMTFVTTGGRRRLGEADLALCEELGRRAGVAIENARVHAERTRIATTLQRSLLPPRLPVVPGVSLAARFRAAGEANQVGGDFYDLFAAGGGWMVVIGDVTGKGPEAAAITSLARYTIRTAARYEPDPVGVVSRLNEVLLADAEHPQMCTAACVLITPGADGEPVRAQVVCAGHPPPYLVRTPAVLEELCRPGPLLGAFADAEWEATVVDLVAGDSVVLYTDGVTDARGADGRFGQDRLEATLRDAAGGEADEIAEAVDATLLEFQDGPQRDDVALLVLRAGEGVAGGDSSLVAGSSTVPG